MKTVSWEESQSSGFEHLMFCVLCFDADILLHYYTHVLHEPFSLFLLKDLQSANCCGLSFSRADLQLSNDTVAML